MNRLRGGRYNDERQALSADTHAVALPVEGRIASYDFPIVTFCGQSPDPLGNVGIPASECRATDSDGVGIPTGSGSVDRHTPTR